WAGAGATVPLTGFGFAMAEGVRKAVETQGAAGILTGALTAGAGGITAAVLCALAAAFLTRPKEK
ncbi:MAG: SpoVA/SpoVAEb family sporulation membrane protein, partial [Clostridia bacterium]|nr:SpoVA/SpoVAEb family sporulation membrane protein [Clostridia bacterium]